MILEYARTRVDAHDPQRANPSDAGLDVFYCPSDETKVLKIPAGESVVVETGLKFGVPHGFMLEVKNRSSMAAKKQLIVGACIIDPGYNGELMVNLNNISKQDRVISAGDKIAQVVMIPIIHFRARKIMTDTLYDNPICISNRGKGGFGSTGN